MAAGLARPWPSPLRCNSAKRVGRSCRRLRQETCGLHLRPRRGGRRPVRQGRLKTVRSRGQARHVLPGIARDHGRQTTRTTAMITRAYGDVRDSITTSTSGSQLRPSVDGCPLVTTGSGPWSRLGQGVSRPDRVPDHHCREGGAHSEITTGSAETQTAVLGQAFPRKYATDCQTPCTSTKTPTAASAVERLRLRRRQGHVDAVLTTVRKGVKPRRAQRKGNPTDVRQPARPTSFRSRQRDREEIATRQSSQRTADQTVRTSAEETRSVVRHGHVPCSPTLVGTTDRV